MNLEKNHWTVLARIPDINSNTEESLANDESGWLPTSAGRLIQQAMSFKLLVGTALFLLVVAIVPLLTSRTPPGATDPAKVAEQSPTWHGGPTPAPAEAVPAAVAAKPATMVPATSEPIRPPAVVTSEPKTKAPPKPARVAERPLMSTWPKTSTK